jgi:iron(III) transport system permease protein
VFRTVTAPLAVPGLANSFLLVSAASLADFATPLILAGTKFPVLPTQAFLQITGLYDMRGGAALCFLLLVPALAIFVGQRRLTERRGGSFVTITGKAGAATRVKSLSPLAVALLGLICGGVILLVLFFYGVIVAASLVRGLGADNTLSFAHYAHVFSGGLKAVRDTLVIATLAMPAGGLFAVVLGFLVARTEFPGRRALEFTAMINYALPGTIVGIAYLVAFNDPPLALTGTAFILVVCYVFRYSLAGTRATTALLSQIDPAIEEASASLGARRDLTFRRIVLPLIRPALLAGMTVLFIRGMTAISATIFLVSLNWSLVTVRILEGITNLELGQASAFSVLVIVLVYLAVFGTNVLMRRLHAGQVGQAGMLLGG